MLTDNDNSGCRYETPMKTEKQRDILPFKFPDLVLVQTRTNTQRKKKQQTFSI